ncbi:MAG: metallophosphoesterase [Arcanobacterium sp.]|nr:metallophosphoesterase [Arcanobacterium sp.]
MQRAAWAAIAAASTCAVGIGTTAAAYLHARHYVLRRRSVLIPRFSALSGAPGLRILHLSDLHALARHKKLLEFTRHLSMINPDLVVITGDLISEDAAIEPLITALRAFHGVPGIFVCGSNDYFSPRFRNPLRYLVRNSNDGQDNDGQDCAPIGGKSGKHQPLATAKLIAALEELGFVNLTNTRATLRIANFAVHAIGVDDPHMGLDRYPEPLSEPEQPALSPEAGGPNETSEQIAQLTIGVTHAPYSHVLNRMAADGCELIFAGHTHGGQVCLPGHRALVTNCDLPPRLASGLFAWPPQHISPIKGNGAVIVAESAQTAGHSTSSHPAAYVKNDAVFSESTAPSPARTWVHISAGLGTSPFVPLRTWCAPEAIQIDVINM